MNKLAYPIFAALVTGLIACQEPQAVQSENQVESSDQKLARAAAVGPWVNVLTDNFNAGGSLSQWTMANRADYNSSKCIYSPSVPAIGSLDGLSCLLITATKTSTGYQSGLCKSVFSFKPAVNQEFHTYAKIKLIARSGVTYKGFAETYGAWPAFWTVQETAWPTKGEIDIMEGYSYGGTARFASNLFYGTTSGVNQLGTSAERSYTVAEGWHTYEQYWKNQQGAVTVTIIVDGVTRATYTNATNSALRLENFGPHNVIVNLNVGSNNNLFNNSLINLFDRTLMYVDYVKVDKRTL